MLQGCLRCCHKCRAALSSATSARSEWLPVRSNTSNTSFDAITVKLAQAPSTSLGSDTTAAHCLDSDVLLGLPGQQAACSSTGADAGGSADGSAGGSKRGSPRSPSGGSPGGAAGALRALLGRCAGGERPGGLKRSASSGTQQPVRSPIKYEHGE